MNIYFDKTIHTRLLICLIGREWRQENKKVPSKVICRMRVHVRYTCMHIYDRNKHCTRKNRSYQQTCERCSTSLVTKYSKLIMK